MRTDQPRDKLTRREMLRLAAAAKFLDGFISIKTGNVNYPATATLAFVLCGQVLGEPHYVDRGRKLAHQVVDQFTSDGFLFGEGHPLDGVSPKGCRPVDLGYNIEGSLPALALYSLLTGDKAVERQVISALKTHIEFQLPDGAWDNSWGTHNYKWSWWGSRTSDGCHLGFLLMANCTHEGLLYGGPDYKAHGDLPCIHHTFTHAKALATALDRCSFPPEPARPAIPRDEPYGLRSFSAIGTHLAAIGPWRATVTEYDWEYQEHAQAGGRFGGHVSGGALSVLYHMKLGPILTASMTHYEMIEISNQQQERGAPRRTCPSLRVSSALPATHTPASTTTVHRCRRQTLARVWCLLDEQREGDGLLYVATWTIDKSGVEHRQGNHNFR